jgi:pimeloyl-ACP methyl ester carboxylesterase
MTTSYSWRYALAPLGERFTCYAPDLPGAGRTERANDRSYHPDALAQWLGALQRGLGIRGERVIGNSMGGYLCLRLALPIRGRSRASSALTLPGSPSSGLPYFAPRWPSPVRAPSSLTSYGAIRCGGRMRTCTTGTSP